MTWLTVEKNVGVSLHSVAGPELEKRERVQYLIDPVGLTGFEKALPHELSGACRSVRRSPVGLHLVRRYCCSTSRSALWVR